LRLLSKRTISTIVCPADQTGPPQRPFRIWTQRSSDDAAIKPVARTSENGGKGSSNAISRDERSLVRTRSPHVLVSITDIRRPSTVHCSPTELCGSSVRCIRRGQVPCRRLRRDRVKLIRPCRHLPHFRRAAPIGCSKTVPGPINGPPRSLTSVPSFGGSCRAQAHGFT
jgi:hypothetical protein